MVKYKTISILALAVGLSVEFGEFDVHLSMPTAESASPGAIMLLRWWTGTWDEILFQAFA